MHDVMDNIKEKTIKCLDKGHVTLIDVMPRLVPDDQKTADYAIVQAARVSYGDGTKTINEDRGLIRFLMRHQHTTPFEMIRWKFHMKMPIFCARQIIRHRMTSVNEVSGRYSVLKDEFYFPTTDNIRQQSKTNKQGGDQQVEDEWANKYLRYLNTICDESYGIYEDFLEVGVSREQARMILPINLYTEWYWCIDLHNLLHFLALRCDAHAQWETRVFADAMLELVQKIVPLAVEAWNDYHPMRQAIKLTRLEIDIIRHYCQGMVLGKLNSDNKREQAEWEEKAKLLGFQIPPQEIKVQ